MLASIPVLDTIMVYVMRLPQGVLANGIIMLKCTVRMTADYLWTFTADCRVLMDRWLSRLDGTDPNDRILSVLVRHPGTRIVQVCRDQA